MQKSASVIIQLDNQDPQRKILYRNTTLRAAT